MLPLMSSMRLYASGSAALASMSARMWFIRLGDLRPRVEALGRSPPGGGDHRAPRVTNLREAPEESWKGVDDHGGIRASPMSAGDRSLTPRDAPPDHGLRVRREKRQIVLQHLRVCFHLSPRARRRKGMRV